MMRNNKLMYIHGKTQGILITVFIEAVYWQMYIVGKNNSDI